MYQKESLTNSTEFNQFQDKHVSLEIFLKNLEEKFKTLLASKNNLFISLAGQSASGKSTISHKIQALSKNAKVLNMDNYLLGWEIGQLNHDPNPGEIPYFAGLNPAVYDLDRFERDLRALKNGKTIDQPIFDEVSKTVVGSTKFEPGQVLIVDGIYTLDERFIEFADLAYLVEAPFHDRLIRKVFRNFYQHLEKVNPIIETYLTRDEPSYAYHQDRLKKTADLIVSNPLNPHFEFSDLVSPKTQLNNLLFNLIPKESAGQLKQGESLFIDYDQDLLYFCYAINGVILLKEPIEETTIKLLSNYYTLL